MLGVTNRMAGFAMAATGFLVLAAAVQEEVLAHSTYCNFTVIVQAGTTNAITFASGYGCAGDCTDPYTNPCAASTHENPDGSVTVHCKCNGQFTAAYCRGRYTESYEVWSLTCIGSQNCDFGTTCGIETSEPYYDEELEMNLQEVWCTCK